MGSSLPLPSSLLKLSILAGVRSTIFFLFRNFTKIFAEETVRSLCVNK